MHPFDVGPWRAPSVNTNTFARESHIDALAAKAGVDPLEFRLKHLSDKRMIGVLQTAAEKFGWKPGKAPSGRGVGVSCGVLLRNLRRHVRRSGGEQDQRAACR